MKTGRKVRRPVLIFPKIVFIRDARIGKRRTRVKVFRLDWTDVDEVRKFPKLVRWQMRRIAKARLHPLSDRLKSAMNTLFFALPGNYLKMIDRYRKLAVDEWGLRRGFDTSVNDECLGVAKECVDNFFYLLSDCLFEPKFENGKPMTDGAITRTWVNYEIGASWKCAMLFRFWLFQTGAAWVAKNADLDGLEKFSKRMKPRKIWTPDEIRTVKFVLGELGKHPCSKILCARGSGH